MFSKSKPQTIDILELTPVVKYKHSTGSEGLVDVLVPRFKNKLMQRLIPKSRSPYIKANLDEIGSQVWKHIDGKRQAGEIAKLLDEKLGEKIAPVHNRLTLFIQQLHNNGFIYFKELSQGKSNG